MLGNSKDVSVLLLGFACAYCVGWNWHVRSFLSCLCIIGAFFLFFKSEVGWMFFLMKIGVSGSMLHSYRVLFLGFVILIMLLCFFSMCCLFRKVENERKNKEAKRVVKNKVFSVACMTAILLRYNGGYTEKARKLFRDFVEENLSGLELYKAEY